MNAAASSETGQEVGRWADATVTVVIPAHDAEATIGAAIESVMNQTSAVLEVIVVDDGSSDATSRVASGAAGAGGGAGGGSVPVKVIAQRQGGPSGARNAGIAAARGSWIGFLDADDRWRPRKLELQLGVVAQHPDAVVVASDWVREEGSMREEGEASMPGCTALSDRDILILNRFQTSTALCRTDVLRSLGGFDRSLDGVEDWDMWLRLAGVGTVLKLDMPLVVYRDSSGGYSKDLWRVYSTMLAMLDRQPTSQASRRLRRCGGRRGSGPVEHAASPGVEAVLCWHHLRFVVAFSLLRHWTDTTRVLAEMRRRSMLRWIPVAAVFYLAPFLFRRLQGRFRRLVRR